jgi:hypothetical protein
VCPAGGCWLSAGVAGGCCGDRRTRRGRTVDAVHQRSASADRPRTQWLTLGLGHEHHTDCPEEQLETFRRRAFPEPGAVLREGPELANDARLDVPSTAVCSSMRSGQIKGAVEEGYAWLGGLAELRDVTYIDLPTSHWPMWSRPQELAAVISDAAQRASAA